MSTPAIAQLAAAHDLPIDPASIRVTVATSPAYARALGKLIAALHRVDAQRARDAGLMCSMVCTR